jgi:hypothetical protein
MGGKHNGPSLLLGESPWKMMLRRNLHSVHLHALCHEKMPVHRLAEKAEADVVYRVSRNPISQPLSRSLPPCAHLDCWLQQRRPLPGHGFAIAYQTWKPRSANLQPTIMLYSPLVQPLHHDGMVANLRLGPSWRNFRGPDVRRVRGSAVLLAFFSLKSQSLPNRRTMFAKQFQACFLLTRS